MFHRVATHLPGLGGVDQFNQLSLEEANQLLGMIVKDLKRRAKATSGK